MTGRFASEGPADVRIDPAPTAQDGGGIPSGGEKEDDPAPIRV